MPFDDDGISIFRRTVQTEALSVLLAMKVSSRLHVNVAYCLLRRRGCSAVVYPCILFLRFFKNHYRRNTLVSICLVVFLRFWTVFDPLPDLHT